MVYSKSKSTVLNKNTASSIPYYYLPNLNYQTVPLCFYLVDDVIALLHVIAFKLQLRCIIKHFMFNLVGEDSPLESTLQYMSVPTYLYTYVSIVLFNNIVFLSGIDQTIGNELRDDIDLITARLLDIPGRIYPFCHHLFEFLYIFYLNLF